MVLSAAGVEKSEKELRDITGCTIEGTDALAVVDAARSLGFNQTRKYNLDFEDLKTALDQNQYPIIFLKTRLSSGGLLQQHSVVVVEIKQDKVWLHDPAREELELDKTTFLQEWNAMRCLTILIE